MLECLESVPVLVVAGHYGVGKTNLALNLACDAQAQGYRVTLIDMDIVNPYFRSSEYADKLEAQGIEVICPVFARSGSSLDVPSLSPQVGPAIRIAQADFAAGGRGRVIIDVGGDDAGATALGRYREDVLAAPYALYYVVNVFRNLTQTVDEALEIMREIEVASGLQVTALVSNAHLKAETEVGTVVRGAEFAEQVAQACGLPLVGITVPEHLFEETLNELRKESDTFSLYPVQTMVRTPWE